MAALRIWSRNAMAHRAECGSSVRFYATKQAFEAAYEREDEDEFRAANPSQFKKSSKQGNAATQRARQQEPIPQMKWQFDMRVVDVNRTFKVTKSGGIQSFTAFVVCGNYEGIAGYGKGKAGDVAYAVDKAYRRSIKNLHFFDVYRGRTVYHNMRSKFGATEVRLWPAEKGKGLVANAIVGDILYLAGYKDMCTKVLGSRHPHNTVKALFKALCDIETPDDVPC